MTEGVIADSFGLVKEAPSKIETRIFKASLTFQGAPKSNVFLRS